jgi:type II secretory pathway pseudopilin PulG
MAHFSLQLKNNSLVRPVKFKTSPAFSIIEIVTVLFIVSVALLGIMSLIVQNIQSQSYNKQTLMAYQLAQEGIELIRKVRDSNWANNHNPGHQSIYTFNNNLAPGTYYMDYRDSVPHVAGSNTGPLSLDSNNFYVHGGTGTSTGFSRLITIQSWPATGQPYFIQVYSDVVWYEHGHHYDYRLVTSLYDWY